MISGESRGVRSAKDLISMHRSCGVTVHEPASAVEVATELAALLVMYALLLRDSRVDHAIMSLAKAHLKVSPLQLLLMLLLLLLIVQVLLETASPPQRVSVGRSCRGG